MPASSAKKIDRGGERKTEDGGGGVAGDGQVRKVNNRILFDKSVRHFFGDLDGGVMHFDMCLERLRIDSSLTANANEEVVGLVDHDATCGEIEIRVGADSVAVGIAPIQGEIKSRGLDLSVGEGKSRDGIAHVGNWRRGTAEIEAGDIADGFGTGGRRRTSSRNIGVLRNAGRRDRGAG